MCLGKVGFSIGGNGLIDCLVRILTILWSDSGVSSAVACNTRLLLFVRRTSKIFSFLVGTFTYCDRRFSDINPSTDLAAWSELFAVKSSQFSPGRFMSPPMIISMCCSAVAFFMYVARKFRSMLVFSTGVSGGL